jgi:hypothetical protein
MSINRRELMQGIVASAIAASALPKLTAQGSIGSKQIRTRSSRREGERQRLYLNEPTLARLKERFETDKEWANQLLADGNELLIEQFFSEIAAKEGGGQQANYGKPAKQIAYMGVTLGLLYELTGETKYAQKLYAAMQHYGQYSLWGGPGLLDRDPPWHSELDTGQFCFGFANGYDTLYPYLSKPQRAQVRSDLFRLGISPTLNDWILPGKRFHSLDSMGHNWWGVCVANAGVAALALLDDDHRAEQWVEQLDAGFVEWFTYAGNPLHNRIETFEATGPSYEGVNYTRYGVTNYLRYLLAWRTRYPEKKAATLEFLTGLPEFFLHTLYPATSGSLPVNFDDCPEDANASECILLLLACGIDDDYGRTYLAHAHGLTADPLPLYVKQPPAISAASLPLSKVYPQMGWAMMRNSWQKDATLLAVKSGYTWNHAHADASTFLLMHKGSAVIIDSGTCNYARHEYTTYYRQSHAHNVILFDGQGQPDEQINLGVKFRGSILKWNDSLGIRYIAVDATGPMAYLTTRNYRHFLWIGNVILILDDIRTFKDMPLDWLLHTAGDVEEHGLGQLHVRNGNASVQFSMLYPETKTETRQGLVQERPDEKIPYHVFSTSTNNRRQRFISAIELEPSSPTKLEVQERSEFLEIQIERGDERHVVFLNLKSIDGSYSLSSTISIGEWSTDAFLVMLSWRGDSDPTPEQVSHFFTVDASFLRWSGNSVMESLSKCDCLWNTGPLMEAVTQGQRNLSCSIFNTQKPKQVIWNGRKVDLSFDPGTHLIQLSSFDSESVPSK